METEISCVNLPPWAKGYADGDYTKIGAVLPTRNGNFVSNAVLMYECQSGRYVDGNSTRIMPVYTVITDAGSLLELTISELKDSFHPPIYITDIVDCPAVRAYEYKKNLTPVKQDINKELLASLEETRKLLALVTFLSRKLVNHPDKETINGINEVLKRARETCEEAKKSINA